MFYVTPFFRIWLFEGAAYCSRSLWFTA